MLRRDRRRLDIAGDSQLSRIKTEQAILNFFDWDQLGNRLSVLRDNELCLPCLHFIHNCQALSFERSRRDRFQESHLTMVIIPWSYFRCGVYRIVHLKNNRIGQDHFRPLALPSQREPTPGTSGASAASLCWATPNENARNFLSPGSPFSLGRTQGCGIQRNA